MGAICKIISVHSNDLSAVLNYTEDIKKTSMDTIEQITEYTGNSEKTTLHTSDNEKVILVTGYHCLPETAKDDFKKACLKYREHNPESVQIMDFYDKKTKEIRHVEKHPVIAHHIIQSFDDPNIDPILANKIGLELAERLGVQAVISTHLNTKHTHNHIVANAYAEDGTHKLLSNKELILRIRELSDEIQREYGITISFDEPKKQLKKSKGDKSYKEWSEIKNGTSWKEQLKIDIQMVKEIAKDKDEFIQIMQAYGYQINKQEGTDNIQWLMPNNKKIWDYTLGDEYTLAALYYSNHHQYKITDTKKEKIPLISVSKYTKNGRRRTDLELLIRKTISIVQRVINYLNSLDTKRAENYNRKDALEQMQNALITLEKYNISSIEQLTKTLNTTGIELNKIKQEISKDECKTNYYQSLLWAIKQYQDAQTLFDSVHYWKKDHTYFINSYSDIDIRHKQAEQFPLNAKQKKELFTLMKKYPELKIDNPGPNYSNISLIQYYEIKDFINNNTTRPTYLIDKDTSIADNAYKNQYQILSEKLVDNPTQKQKKIACTLLKEHGYSNINPSNLTMADIININNCYQPNPFNKSLIDSKKQKELQSLLDKTEFRLSRKIEYINDDEYVELINFLKKETKRIPELLKEQPSVNQQNLDKVSSLHYKSMTEITIPLSEMNAHDIQLYYNWLISQGKKPICLLDNNKLAWKTNRDLFIQDISEETPRKQDILIQLRQSINGLAELGLTPEDIPRIQKEYQELLSIKEEKESKNKELSSFYKELMRLKQQISYSTNDHFLYGKNILTNHEIEEIKKQLIMDEEKDISIEYKENHPNENAEQKKKTYTASEWYEKEPREQKPYSIEKEKKKQKDYTR